MDLNAIGQLITQYGVFGVIAYMLYIDSKKKDELNRADTMREINRLEGQIVDSKKQAEEERNIFRQAIDSFNKAIEEFKSRDKDIVEIKEDIKEIKEKIN